MEIVEPSNIHAPVATPVSGASTLNGDSTSFPNTTPSTPLKPIQPSQNIQNSLLVPQTPQQTILNHNVVLTATSDSPMFRAMLDDFIDKLEEATKWVEGLARAMKHYEDEIVGYNDATTSLVNRLGGAPLDLMGEDLGIPLARLMRDGLTSVVTQRHGYIDLLLKQVFEPLQQCLKDIKLIKDDKRAFSKLQEKYDYIVSKFVAIPKSKEASAVREEEFQVADLRKQYIHASLSHGMKILEFKAQFRRTISTLLIRCIKLHQEHLASCHSIFSQNISSLQELEQKLEVTSLACTKELEHLQNQKTSLEDEAKLFADPLTPKPMWMMTMSSNSSLPPSPKKKAFGTLFRTVSFVNDPLPPFPVKDMTHSRNPSLDSPIKPRSSSLSVKSSPPRPVRQLEPNFQSMEGWLFKQSRGNKWRRRYFKLSKGYLCYWSEQVDNGSQTNLVPLSQDRWVASAPFNVLLSQVRQIASDRRFTFEIVSPDKTFVLQAEREVEMLTWIRALEDAKLYSFQTYTEEQITQLSAPQGKNEAVQGMLLPGKPMVAEPVQVQEGPQEPIETIKYPDSQYDKKNQELHAIFKSLPAKDHLIVSASCLFQRDIALHGKMYLTQNSLCFHSNILGYVTVLIVQIKDIISITKKVGTIQNTIVVSTAENQHTFKTFLKEDTKIYATLKTIWENGRQEEAKEEARRKTAQELFDHIHETILGRIPDTIEETRTVSMLDLDVSDDEGLEPLVEDCPPADFQPPTTLPVCGCDAEDHYESAFDVTLPYSATQVYKRAFAANSSDALWKSLHAKKGNRNLTIGTWNNDSMGEVREIKYVMPMNNPMLKVKEATCQETQRLVAKTDHLRYVIEIRVKTPDVPYGDTFDCVTRYCITWKSNKECRITCGTEVDFVKSTMMKGMIRGAAGKGTVETAQLFLASLKESLAPKKKLKDGKEVEVVSPIPITPVESIPKHNHLILPSILLLIFMVNITLYISIRHVNYSLVQVAESCLKK